MRYDRVKEKDWRRYPGLEEAAERGSMAAAVSGLALAVGVILTFGALDLVACLGEEREGRELLLKCSRMNAAAGPNCSNLSSLTLGRDR